MKVAHVMAGARSGGAELFFERLCGALARAGDTVLPIIRHNPDRAERLRQAGVGARQLGFGGAFDVFTRPRLGRLLREFAPEVVVAWMNRAARFTPKGPWTLVGRLGGYYDVDYYRRCDHLIGNTRGLVEWIIDQGVPPDRVHHVPNFVTDMAGAAPERLDVPPGARMLLGLGRLHRNKGFDLLIHALPRLPGAYAVIAGEGPERDRLLALARSEGVADRLRLPGWRTDTAALLAGCDVFVCSSREEALGNMVIEAFSASRPVVAAAIGGPRELIDSGENGLLVPTEDPGALAMAVQSVLDHPAMGARLAGAGRASFASAHAEAPVIARWQAFLQSVRVPA